jgi:hypothetical protein
MKIIFFFLAVIILCFSVNSQAQEKEETAGEAETAGTKIFSAGLKAGLLKATGEVDSTVAFNADLRSIIPVPLFQRNLAFGIEAGWYPYSGGGTQKDPLIGIYDFSWKMNLVPIYAGFTYHLPLSIPLIGIFGTGGFAMNLAYAESRMFDRTTAKSGTAYGFYAGCGAEMKFGPGYLLGEYRFTNIRTNFDLPDFNKKAGDLGGHNILVGYRIFLF